jgi:L-ascorbate metabolism protein UlaG (beta-lactamase superfamily)
MKIQLIRHATLLLQLGDYKILIDPMFSSKGIISTTPNAANDQPNPLVDLPLDIQQLLQVDAIVITHTHRDHLDEKAVEALPKHRPIFCQPVDVEKLKGYGFENVTAVHDEFNWNTIKLTRTKGQHGRGEIGQKMGPVSGFVFKMDGEPVLYIAGDTVWCEEVENALDQYHPALAILFAGAAQFLTGGPITMDKEDILKVAKKTPGTKIVVAHMESWNHCLLSREELTYFVEENGLINQIYIPKDGEEIQL